MNTTQATKATRHPAKYTNKFLPVFAEILNKFDSKNVFDPFAGTCKIAKVRDFGFEGKIFANELEPEWAEQGLGEVDCLNIGDAEFLPFKDGMFDAICTSPTYGNRMADKHNAKDGSRRNTYTHSIERQLTDGNTGAMQWGPEYRKKHENIYKELSRVLTIGGIFILNMSDHIRKGEVIPATEWHVLTLTGIGFEVVEWIKVETPRQKFGANANVRVEFESIVVLQKKVV